MFFVSRRRRQTRCAIVTGVQTCALPILCSHRDIKSGWMIEISSETYRHAYAIWLRTGSWPVAQHHGDIEVKFNPYHDPRNGQFTFAPGGSRSLSRVIVSPGRRDATRTEGVATVAGGQVGGGLNEIGRAHV